MISFSVCLTYVVVIDFSIHYYHLYNVQQWYGQDFKGFKIILAYQNTSCAKEWCHSLKDQGHTCSLNVDIHLRGQNYTLTSNHKAKNSILCAGLFNRPLPTLFK